MIDEKTLKRFWSKVDKKGPDECWEWKGGYSSSGYGVFMLSYFPKKVISPHRFLFILKNGEIPDGMYICHHCDNRKCVNINHLFLGTAKDNTQDAVKKGRMASGSRQGLSKLTEDDVLKIRKLYSAKKFTLRKLGEKFEVTYQSIHLIVKRKQWRHI